MPAVARVGVELDARKALVGIRQLETRADATAKKFKGLQAVAVKLAGAFAGIQAAKFVFVKTAELERQTKSLEVLTGSLEKAQGVIKELRDFGAVTPFTSGELIETAKRLKAFGFTTEELVDVTKRLGDVAGATGADLGGIATAFGQIQAKGRLQGEELLQLQERGIALQDELQKMYGLTGNEFRKALEGGKISADAVNLALKRITDAGGKYANGAIAQSETLNGKLSTLVDSVETLAKTFGQILAPAIKKTFDFAIQALGALNDLVEVQLLRGELGISISPDVQRELEKTAELIAGQRTGQTGLIKGFAFSEEYNDVLRDLEKSELKRQAYEMGLLKVPKTLVEASKETKIPKLLDEDEQTKKTGKTDAEKAIEQAQLLAKESAARVQSLQDQRLLAAALNEEEAKQFERQIQIRDIIENQKGLTDEQVKAELEATLALFDQQDITANLVKQTEDRIKGEEKLAKTQEEAAAKLQGIYDQIGTTIADGVVNAIGAAVDQTKSLAEVASDTLNNLAQMLLRLGINTALASTGLPIFGSLPGFANGGRPPRNRPSIVGERGPELFVPNTSGTIVPNGEFGMGKSTNIVVNVDAKGSSAQGDGGQAKQLGQAIGAAVQAELIKQKRPGGLLA